MNKLKKYLLGAGCMVLLTLAMALINSGSVGASISAAAAEVIEVRVVNTREEPVPTVAQGTTAVSGSVSIANSPTVKMAQGTIVGINPSNNAVQITNAESAPVAVRDVDFARQPFHQSAEFSFPDGAITRTTSITIPAGKRLVIEYVSGLLVVPTGQNITKITLGVTLDQQFANHFVARTPVGDSGFDNELFSVSQQMRVYADGLFINIQRGSATGTASGTVTLSGYLVDIP
jgi:hypothetical protein